MEDRMPESRRLKAIKAHAEAEKALLKEEISIYLDHCVAVAGHPSPMSDLTDLLDRLAVQQGLIDIIEKEFQ
jgi:hypothetical protein